MKYREKIGKFFNFLPDEVTQKMYTFQVVHNNWSNRCTQGNNRHRRKYIERFFFFLLLLIKRRQRRKKRMNFFFFLLINVKCFYFVKSVGQSDSTTSTLPPPKKKKNMTLLSPSSRGRDNYRRTGIIVARFGVYKIHRRCITRRTAMQHA